MHSILTVACLLCAAEPAALPPIEMPRVLDPRLKLELVCREPDIVTPTGLTIDAKGRILVIENHTHQRPEGYQGPPHDRILLIDPNETPAKPRVWYEGTKNTMNLARAPDDSIYVATRSEIFRVRDTDFDDKADERTEIAYLETAGNYPHNGLSGFAFSPPTMTGTILDASKNMIIDRHMRLFFGLGENLGADYKVIGSDGSSFSGGGEGGSVFVCRMDGSQLQRFATGFWNPFHMCDFISSPHLRSILVVDNDPDSRPPCRLLQVFERGDYGFKFRHGRKGTHPFTSWNGELPGTLPMVCGTGEAPCSINRFSPFQNSHGFVVTSWGDHRIEYYELQSRDDSMTCTGKMQTLVIGEESFRPTGACVADNGTLYFSDWVDKSYPVHGKGRLWKLKPERLKTTDEIAKDREFKITAGSAFNDVIKMTKPADDEAAVLKLLRQGRSFLNGIPGDSLKYHLLSQFVLDYVGYERPLDSDSADAFFHRFAPDGHSESVIWSAVAAQSRHAEDARWLVPYLLKHNESRVRLLGVIWAGDGAMVERRAEVEHVLEMPGLTRELFAATLAALELFDTAGQPLPQTRDFFKRQNSGDTYVLKALNDSKSSAALKQFALKALPPDHPELKFDLLKRLVADADPTMRVEAIRTLRERTDAGRDALLRSIADDGARSDAVRAEASIGLNLDAPPRELPSDARSPAERITALPNDGDPVQGERLFFHPRIASCYRCHEYNGRGATIGPDLTTFGRGANRERILQSVLEPSREIAPHYVPWIIETTDGRTLTGLYVGEEVKGEHRYADAQGRIFLVHPNQIEHREAAKQSIMPADFGKTLTDDELRDLAAFLLR